MIVRLVIENLAVVGSAELAPGPGLTAVTGETGAGKTLLATAVTLLSGGDATAGQVGTLADHAWVEGEFDVDRSFWQEPSVAAITSLRPEPDAPLVLARRIDASGRSRALAWGRTVAKSDLAAAGALLVTSAGQHVQRRLLEPAAQRLLVDRAAGDDHASLLVAMRETWADLARCRDELRRVEADATRLAAQRERIADDLSHIEGVDPTPEEERELVAARDRARHHADLQQALATALGAIEGSVDAAGAVDAIGVAVASVGQAADLDPTLAVDATALESVQELLQDSVGGLRSRLDALADGPASLDDIEERLAAYDSLRRRFGGTIEAVMAMLLELRGQASLLDDVDGARTAAEAALASAQDAADEVAQRITRARAVAGAELARRVEGTLAELGMASSQLRVAVEPAPLAAHGADRVELQLAPAAGIEPRPIAQVASGGEVSRIALALLVESGAADAATLVFDEIDAGIGGRTAHAVASLLRRLADTRQVLVITHLPQVAARADAHVVIRRSGADTTARTLGDEAAVLDELCRMLGADDADEAAREHARVLRGGRFGITSGAGAPRQATLPLDA